ncbi:glycosyl hydrolase 115 family protein [Mucilaginibacter terrae]|uniref:glycosyl hydrolase 115 family protein n=1 Tax=Mucilaginibacter terrae TaxID=1955052 RepID=UPI0036294BF1
MKKCLIILFFLSLNVVCIGQQLFTEKKEAGSFAIVAPNQLATIVYDTKDDSLVRIAATLLAQDVERVTGKKPLLAAKIPASGNLILMGTIGKSALIRQLVKSGRLDSSKFAGKWDGFLVQLIQNPFKGVKQALVIAGNDKRGAAYGAMELSRQMGISPWYWWADVPVKRKAALFFKSNGLIAEAPKVKYRGIFINDEAPCFSRWTKEKFGGVNHLVYEKIFELLIRLKANYLWPAMWSNAFNDDDKLNPILADQWGIVMGTSHHEPMQRAQQEWKRYGKGPWDYTKNDTVLRSFWKKGIENMGTHESIVTLAMRGDGDEPMTQGTATNLLEKIVKDQRSIIEEVTKKPASATPQLWALYKEVQDYYDKGMRVPDDVTLLLSDDNWGNIRKLPKPGSKPRTGGYGIYYHFDYVGDPRNYKWINTNNIARVWEQMHLAYEHNVNNIWIVNVGDIKPLEFPISFFLDYAWNPDKWNQENLRSYYTDWAGKQFGLKYASEIGNIMRLYAQYTARRKPELVDARSYSIENYNEFGRVTKEFNQLLAKAEKINTLLPENYRDAYFQVVLHPLKANANLHDMYEAAAWNNWYSTRKDPKANQYADKVKELYHKDSLLSVQYNMMGNGKWNHMMDQVHIGYKTWNDPRYDVMPTVTYVAAGSAPESYALPVLVSKTAEKAIPLSTKTPVFFEKDNYVSIEAANYTRATSTNAIKWVSIPDIGRTGAGVTTFPVSAGPQTPGKGTPRLYYDFYTYNTSDKLEVSAYFSPTLNFFNEEKGLQYAVSIDGEDPQIITINTYTDPNIWRGWTASNIIIKKTNHKPLAAGKHTLQYWMVQPGVILQKLVIDMGGVKPSYLGPPETLKK